MKRLRIGPGCIAHGLLQRTLTVSLPDVLQAAGLEDSCENVQAARLRLLDFLDELPWDVAGDALFSEDSPPMRRDSR